VFTACLLLGSPAFAQNRSWVSGVGDDANNPCSRTQPCRTFQMAIANTDAGGEIMVLDPGNYDAVTITKPITISGVGTHASILASNGTAIHIQITSPPDASLKPTVTLRNLQLNGFNSGQGQGIFVDSTIPTEVIVDDVNVAGFVNAVLVHYANKVSINGGVFSNNVIAIHGMFTSSINVENARIDGNDVAVQPADSTTIRLSNNGIYDNKTGFACGAGTIASAGNNRKGNNVGGGVPTCTPTVAITIQ